MPKRGRCKWAEGIGDKIQGLFNGFGPYVSIIVTILMGLLIYGIPTLILLLLLYLLLFGRIGLLKKVWRLLNDRGRV
jgi:hypothetical protein